MSLDRRATRRYNIASYYAAQSSERKADGTMFDKSQLMRGTLEGCILKIISLTVTYGYEILEQLKLFGFDEIQEGTIYPLLVRLENKEYISSELRPSPFGPNRKYYSLTAEGAGYLQTFETYWNRLLVSAGKILSLEAVENESDKKA